MKFIKGIFKWLVILAFSLSAGLLVIIFLSDDPQITPFLLRILILLAVGFIGALLMRILFRKWFALILLFFALISSTLAVFIIDLFYETEFMLSFIPKDINALSYSNFGFQIPSPADGAQMGLLLLISVPIILLFRRKKRIKTSEKPPAKPARVSLADRLKPIGYKINPKNWNVRLPKFKKSKKTKRIPAAQKKASPSVHISSKPAKRTSKSPVLRSGSQKMTASKKVNVPRKGSYKNNDVKLMGEEEHVCPYCLEEVVKNDPRGVAVCPECSTWHHQDCWDITGGCGVAHRNEL